jgi:nucleoside-diphosphate-sugar epimerase
MNKILITGGAGYIGNVLVNHLLQKNYDVTVIDNLIHRKHNILQYCNNPNFNFIYGDVRNEELYGNVIAKNDIIINLAAYVGMPVCKKFPNESQQVNQDSVKFLASKSSKDQLIIYTTTNSGYGTGDHSNGNAIHCNESTPLKPISLYGETKCMAEKYLMDVGNAISFRLATVFGISPKMRLDLLINDFVWRAWNDKFIVLFESHFLRNFIHIQDVANTVSFAISNQSKMKGEVYNVGNTSINMSKMDLCLEIKKQIPEFYITTSEINKDPDQRNYIVSNEKLESLGWKCNYDLQMGISEIIKACPIIKNTNFLFTDI